MQSPVHKIGRRQIKIAVGNEGRKARKGGAPCQTTLVWSSVPLACFGIARDAVWVEATVAKDRGLTAVLLSAASLEALVNEVTCEAEIEVRLARAEGPLEPWLDVLEAFVEAMSEAERSRGSTQLKYIIASRVLGGPVHRRGAQPYQDFALLMDLRNTIMHLRPTTFVGSEEGPWQLQSGAVVKELEAHGLVEPPRPGTATSLIDEVSRPLVARWAVNTAAKMAQSFLSMFPEPFRGEILVDHKEAFRPIDPAGQNRLH